MVSRLMIALALVAAVVTGGVATTVVHVSANGVPAPSGTPTPTRHGHGLV